MRDDGLMETPSPAKATQVLLPSAAPASPVREAPANASNAPLTFWRLYLWG
jgi:hypothetical protein